MNAIKNDFKGIYNIWEKNVNLFTGDPRKDIEDTIEISDLGSSELDDLIGTTAADTLRDELELAQGVYPEFENEAYLEGRLQPVFFGSALNNFGVRELLDCLHRILVDVFYVCSMAR